MDSQRITITINAVTDMSSVAENNSRSKLKRESISGSSGVNDSRGAVLPGAAMMMKAAIGDVATMPNELSCKVTMVPRSRSPIRSPMPALPYPPKHTINQAWKKVPPIPKVSVTTGPGTIRLIWNDGISLGSYHLYAPIAGQEVFACVFEDEGNQDHVQWEKLTFLKAPQSSHNRRRPVICDMTDMVTGVEYYFAIRPVDVHNRRGPCAVAYARL